MLGGGWVDLGELAEEQRVKAGRIKGIADLCKESGSNEWQESTAITAITVSHSCFVTPAPGPCSVGTWPSSRSINRSRVR